MSGTDREATEMYPEVANRTVPHAQGEEVLHFNSLQVRETEIGESKEVAGEKRTLIQSTDICKCLCISH
jgi:hypothetical protein